jgi:hypothetical protein
MSKIRTRNAGALLMGIHNNNYNGSERRLVERRMQQDRRSTTRFSDILGRRCGVDRRLPVRA